MLIFPMKQMGLNPNQFLAASVLPLCFSPSAHASFDKSSSSTLPSLDTSNFTTSRCLFLFPMTTGDKLPSDKQKLKNRLCFLLEVPSFSIWSHNALQILPPSLVSARTHSKCSLFCCFWPNLPSPQHFTPSAACLYLIIASSLQQSQALDRLYKQKTPKKPLVSCLPSLEPTPTFVRVGSSSRNVRRAFHCYSFSRLP